MPDLDVNAWIELRPKLPLASPVHRDVFHFQEEGLHPGTPRLPHSLWLLSRLW